MDKNNISGIPDENKIEGLLAKIQPVPSERFHQKMEHAAWRVDGEQQAILINVRWKIALAIVAIAALTVLFVTPQGHAFAQRIFLFFTVTEEKSFPIPTEQVYSIPSTESPVPSYILPLQPVEASTEPAKSPELLDQSCTSPESKSGYFCQIKAVEARAGFDAKEFLYDPRGMKFSAAVFVPVTGEIRTEFVVITGGGYLYLRQGETDFPIQTDTWGKVPSDAVEQVLVNGQYAEIASGTFVVYPNATSAVWEPGGQLSLAWRDGNRWFTLEKLGDPYPIEWITKDELIKLAESLIDARPVDAIPPLDPEYLSTVEQAETLAGFDIPTPTMLPVGYKLKRVVWTGNVVHLMYGPHSELFISLGQIANFQAGPCTECPLGVTETVQVGLWQGWYWRGIFSTGPAIAGQPTPTPIWEGDAAYWSLAWNTDKLWLGISYSPSFNSGKEMNKETLIKIAESLK
jgi:hypothetical protein